MLLLALIVAVPAALLPYSPAAVALTPPPVSRDAGTFTSTLYPEPHAFPRGGAALRAVVRDCGFSVALPNGKSLWLFCDTAVFDQVAGTAPDLDAELRMVGSGTAGLATTTVQPSPANPVALHEASYPAMPKAWITSSGQYGSGAERRAIACPGGESAVAWTKGMVALPGRSTVVSFFQDHCPNVAAGFPEYDIGVAEYDAPATAADDFAGADQLQVTRRFDSVLTNPVPGSTTRWGYGDGAVVDGEYLYAYSANPGQLDCRAGGCTEIARGAVTVARVRWAGGEYRSSANYEYYTGSIGARWSADPTQARDVLRDTRWPSGDGMSVMWSPQIQRFVMAHANSRISPSTGASVRTSTTPWGPWSAPTDVAIDASSSFANPAGGCDSSTPCRTFFLHPELSSVDDTHFYLSYVRHNDFATDEGAPVTFAGAATMQVRLAAIPFASLAVAAPETVLTDHPTDPSSSGVPTFSFEAAVAGSADASTGSSPASPMTYRCSFDGGAATTCASPTSAPLSEGRHVFSVAAVDANGLADPDPVAWAWTIDRSPPDTTIDAGPASPSNAAGSTFRFSGRDDQAVPDELSFECALDGEPFADCASPITFDRVTTGAHELAVRGLDGAGNADPSAATWSWTVDTDPTITWTATPPPWTNDRSASFVATLGDDNTPTDQLQATCGWDGEATAACSWPASRTLLADGPHAFTVEVRDETGNRSSRTSTWTVDTIAPSASIDVDPAPVTAATGMTFGLRATDDLAPSDAMAFFCAVDGGPVEPCPSTLVLEGLSDGAHDLAVVAVDPAGNPSGETHRGWIVDTTLPSIEIVAGPPSSTTANDATFSFVGADDRAAPAAITFSCAIDGGAPAACAASSTFTGLAPGRHALQVVAVDEARNRSAAARWEWSIDHVVTSAPPGTGSTGVAYGHAFTTNGLNGSEVRYQLAAGQLPPGLNLRADGSIVGTPTASGSFGPITVTASETAGTTSQTFVLLVVEIDAVRGVVRNRVTGVPVPGVRVRIFTVSGLLMAESTTGTDGSYRIGYLRAGSYRLSYFDPGGAHVTVFSGNAAAMPDATVINTVGGTTASMDVTMVPLTTIAGVVTDQVTNVPIAGTWVSLFDSGGRSLGLAVTAPDGSYRFSGLVAGSYRLRFADPTGNHVAEYWDNRPTLAWAKAIAASAGGTIAANASLAPLTVVTGVVRDGATGLPLAKMWVSLLDAGGKPVGLLITGADGRYRFGYLAMASYRLRFSDPTGGHATSYWRDATTFASATAVVAAGGTVVADGVLAPLTTIEGSITDQVTAGPVAGAMVTVLNESGTPITYTQADASGWYRFLNLVAGTYRLLFADPTAAHTSEYWNDAATFASATPLRAAGGKVTADVALTPLSTVRGQLRDRVTLQPIPGARVVLYAPSGSTLAMAFTDADGAFVFVNLAPASYRLGFGDPTGGHFPGFSGSSSTLADATVVTTSPGLTATSDATLEPATTISGTVTDRLSAQPISGVRVLLLDEGGRAVGMAYTDADGRYRFVNLRVAVYRLSFTDPTGGRAMQFWNGGTTLADSTPISAAGGVVIADVAL
jgi:hypothetical protein